MRRLKRKQIKYTTFENVVIFPGTVEKLIARAHEYVENYQYDLANKSFEEALKYTEGDEVTLSVYAYSLYETKTFERAKEVCEQLLSIGPTMYLEVMELYLTICMQLKQYKQVESIITSLLEEGAIPQEQIDKFERLKDINANIADNAKKQEDITTSVNEIDGELFQLEKFMSLSPDKQLTLIHELTTMNIRPIVQQLKTIIENEDTHPFIKSIVLILLVEQQVDINIKISKFNQEKYVNPSVLELPTKMPQFNAVSKMIIEKLEKDPSTLEMVEYLLSKHAIVTYPFEWLHYETEDIALSYIDLVRTMFGSVQEMDDELVEFLQILEKLTELQEV
ncbi:tetratricopeptide repeat protein [Ureibacillus sp. GCM10028918]|uniref:tetratricopeptide repeat protein n=1 Tax=Ureibacillus sp. GCM10028918 TaxID=3273429 RepID=UPI00360B4DA0